MLYHNKKHILHVQKLHFSILNSHFVSSFEVFKECYEVSIKNEIVKLLNYHVISMISTFDIQSQTFCNPFRRVPNRGKANQLRHCSVQSHISGSDAM